MAQNFRNMTAKTYFNKTFSVISCSVNRQSSRTSSESTVLWNFSRVRIHPLRWLEVLSTRIFARFWRILRHIYSDEICSSQCFSEIKTRWRLKASSVRFVARERLFFLERSVMGFEWKIHAHLRTRPSYLRTRPNEISISFSVTSDKMAEQLKRG